ncbi:hypothetical protein MHBO_003272 [Bonamia ostreae]|uniref:Uncharacterized protein n=1 Tax=Bonamia ostreae TaxID=126728 RepID=A0ABV2AQQ0_9EUKA
METNQNSNSKMDKENKTINEEKKIGRNYYIADLSASSEDDENEGTTAENFETRSRNYIESLQQEALSAPNKELREHIRQTQLREQNRNERLAQGAMVFSGDASLENGLKKSHFDQSGVNIRYKHDGRVVDEKEDLKTEKLLPSLSDPKLWKVGCPVFIKF